MSVGNRFVYEEVLVGAVVSVELIRHLYKIIVAAFSRIFLRLVNYWRWQKTAEVPRKRYPHCHDFDLVLQRYYYPHHRK